MWCEIASSEGTVGVLSRLWLRWSVCGRNSMCPNTCCTNARHEAMQRAKHSNMDSWRAIIINRMVTSLRSDVAFEATDYKLAYKLTATCVRAQQMPLMAQIKVRAGSCRSWTTFISQPLACLSIMAYSFKLQSAVFFARAQTHTHKIQIN